MNLELIKNFYPYHDFAADTVTKSVTPWMVTFILAYFVIGGIYLWIRLWMLGRTIRDLASAIDQNTTETIEKLRKHPRLNHLWAEYERTFLNNRNNLLSVADAEDIFDEQSVISVHVNLRYWSSVPGIILAIGIFGTFLGLTLGVQGFDTSSSEGIQDSIQTLLNGMGTAFLTSLWGMALSILFNVHEKFQFQAVRKHLDRFNSKLNAKFQLTTEEARKLDKQERSSLASALFVTEVDGVQLYPSHALRDLLDNSKQQTAALKAFSTELSDGIILSTETINALGDKLMDSLSPTSAKLNEAIEQLLAQKKESSGEFLESIAKNLNDSTEAILSQFRDSVSSSTVQQLEGLAGILANSGESISTLPDRFNEAFSELAEIVERQRQLSEKTEALLGGFNTSLEKVTGVAHSIDTSTRALGDTAAELEATAANTNQVAEGLGQSMREFRTQGSELLASQNQLMAQFQESMSTLENMPRQLSQIKDQFGSVFDDLGKGLEDYQRITKESINQYLGQFSEQVASAVSHLAGGIEELEELVSSLSDLNERTPKS